MDIGWMASLVRQITEPRFSIRRAAPSPLFAPYALAGWLTYTSTR